MNKLKIVFITLLMSLCTVLAAQETISSGDSQSYHGKRMSADSSTFEVVFISTKEGKIVLGFSMPINPQSFTADNIILNGKPLSKDTEIKFNKTGKIVAITASVPSGTQSVLALNKILSFDNQTLEVSEFKELIPEDVKHYVLR